jgi:hypothetical protein
MMANFIFSCHNEKKFFKLQNRQRFYCWMKYFKMFRNLVSSFSGQRKVDPTDPTARRLLATLQSYALLAVGKDSVKPDSFLASLP